MAISKADSSSVIYVVLQKKYDKVVPKMKKGVFKIIMFRLKYCKM